MFDPHPAQRRLVHEHLDWEVVRDRLSRFESIGCAFPMCRLRAGEESPPFYCHYMAWRLGTWRTEGPFARIDELLGGAAGLPGWDHEAHLLKSNDFSVFWSLVWQLQVAEYLRAIGTDVRWGEGNRRCPDLSVQVGSKRVYVECRTHHKSFGLMLFVKEVLEEVDSSIRVAHDLCMPFGLPNDDQRNGFLDGTLRPFLDPELVENARAKATKEYPVVLTTHDSGLVVYVEGPDPGAYVPRRVPYRTGNSTQYLQVALEEAIRAKQNANGLDVHHPNLVVVNYALSSDFQLALGRANGLGLPLPIVDLGPNIDALAVAATGISERLTRRALRLVAPVGPTRNVPERIICANWQDEASDGPVRRTTIPRT